MKRHLTALVAFAAVVAVPAAAFAETTQVNDLLHFSGPSAASEIVALTDSDVTQTLASTGDIGLTTQCATANPDSDSRMASRACREARG